MRNTVCGGGGAGGACPLTCASPTDLAPGARVQAPRGTISGARQESPNNGSFGVNIQSPLQQVLEILPHPPPPWVVGLSQLRCWKGDFLHHPRLGEWFPGVLPEHWAWEETWGVLGVGLAEEEEPQECWGAAEPGPPSFSQLAAGPGRNVPTMRACL